MSLSIVLLHLTTALLLSFCYTATQTHPRDSKTRISTLQAATIITGAIAGTLTLCLPYLVAAQDPLIDCVLRVVGFFYGCKILDLGVTRAGKPPILLSAGQPEALDSTASRLRYTWLLLTETRYAAFDKIGRAHV